MLDAGFRICSAGLGNATDSEPHLLFCLARMPPPARTIDLFSDVCGSDVGDYAENGSGNGEDISDRSHGGWIGVCRRECHAHFCGCFWILGLGWARSDNGIAW
jgi:hypothetical protein